MIDSSVGQHQIQVAAIRQAISGGTLDAETIHQTMLDEISKELDKPLKEVDMDYVNACDKLLELLNRDRAARVESLYASNLVAIRKKLHRFERHKATRPVRACIAGCLTVLLIFGGLLLSWNNLDVTLSPDAEQLIIQGTEGSDVIVSYADEDYASIPPGNYDTGSLEEAVSLYGAEAMIPTWLPEGWQEQQYSVDVIDAYRTINIIYQSDVTDGVLVFQQTMNRNIGLLRTEIEQNEYGRRVSTENGLTVYIAENYDMLTASWFVNGVQCTLAGPITEDELLKCIDSINNMEENTQ